MNLMGKQCYLNDELAGAIWTAIAAGESISSASTSAGVCRQTLHVWIKTGKEDRAKGLNTIFATLANGVDHARTIARATRGVRKQVTRAYLAGVEDGRAQAVLGGAA